jgi:tetratricopeptide (TPR) repeat protein
MNPLWCVLWLALAQDPRPDLQAAEQNYRAGQFAAAFAGFEQALAQPEFAPGPLLYNLGNCAYRLDRVAEAIWFYRRALLELPGDDEVRGNLRRAERRLGLESFVESPVAALLGWVDRAPPGRLLVVVALAQAIGVLGWTWLGRGSGARVFLLLLIGGSLLVVARRLYVQHAPAPLTAIVLSERIRLRSEPHRDLAVVLELRAGESVQVAESSDRWARVLHPRGAGWTECQGLGFVE